MYWPWRARSAASAAFFCFTFCTALAITLPAMSFPSNPMVFSLKRADTQYGQTGGTRMSDGHQSDVGLELPGRRETAARRWQQQVDEQHGVGEIKRHVRLPDPGPRDLPQQDQERGPQAQQQEHDREP